MSARPARKGCLAHPCRGSSSSVGFQQAGLLIRVLRDEQPGPQSWEIKLPKREFLGITQQETGRLVAQLLEQILNSPR